jgi:hypothetical protein
MLQDGRSRLKVSVRSLDLSIYLIPLWLSGQISWLQIRFPALPDFPRSSGSGTESTQPREYN